MSVLLRFQSEEIKKMWTFAIFQSEGIKKMWTFSSPQPKIYHNIFCHIIHYNRKDITEMTKLYALKGRPDLNLKGKNYLKGQRTKDKTCVKGQNYYALERTKLCVM